MRVRICVTILQSGILQTEFDFNLVGFAIGSGIAGLKSQDVVMAQFQVHAIQGFHEIIRIVNGIAVGLIRKRTQYGCARLVLKLGQVNPL